MHRIVTLLLFVALPVCPSLYAESFTPLTQAQYEYQGFRSTVFYYHGLKYAAPCMGDFDGDGDLDLVVGSQADYLTYFRNGGPASTFDPDAMYATLIQIPGESYLAPYPADLDGDGDLDLVVGSNSGQIYLVENLGFTGGAPDFFVHTTPLATAFGRCYPALADEDLDEDLDLFVGQGNNVAFYRNVGSPADANFVKEQNVVLSTFGPDRVTPSFFDLDGDGIAEMLCGNSEGTLASYRKTSSGSTVSYDRITASFGDISVGEYSACFPAYMESYDRPNLVCGDQRGRLRLFRSSGGGTTTYVLAADQLAYLDLGDGSSYKLVDLDGDGRVDLLATWSNSIVYLQNTGSDPRNPSWRLVSESLVTTTHPILSLDVWDYDRDGDIDIVFGNDSGGIGLLENTGSEFEPAFEEIYPGYRYTPDSLFDGMKIEAPYSSIALVDVDADGDRDAVIVSGWGTSAFYRNDNIDTNQGGPDNTLDPWAPGDFVMIRSGAGASSSYFPSGTGTQGRIAGWDIDADGDPDFLNTGILGTIAVLRNMGTPEAAQYVREATPFAGINFDPEDTGRPTVTIDVGDLDGDGAFDLVLGGAGGGLRIYLNDAPTDPLTPALDGGVLPSDSGLLPSDSGLLPSDSGLEKTHGSGCACHANGSAAGGPILIVLLLLMCFRRRHT